MLTATDVAARGIDVKDVRIVCNFDMVMLPLYAISINIVAYSNYEL
jgi:superfamily II DNA/RNA helicase